MSRCLVPVTIKNPHYGTKPNQSPFLSVPCGKCANCIANRRSVWCWRLQQEKRDSTTAYFVTLTYSDENVPVDYDTGEICLRKSDLQKWLKRVRKWYPKKDGFNIRYFAVGEYGDNTLRPHYHVLLFNLPLDLLHAAPFIRDSWGLGHTLIDVISDGRIAYCTKYMLKYMITEEEYDKELDTHRPFMVCSRKPLIGYRYISKYRQWHLSKPSRTTALTTFGTHVRLPDSFVKHIFYGHDSEKQLFTSFRKKFADASAELQSERCQYLLRQESLGIRVDWDDEFPDPVRTTSRLDEQMRKRILQNKSKREL